MTISELKKILEKFDSENDDDDVLIEYMPRPHEFVTEHIIGVRSESPEHRVVLMGVTEF